MFVLAASTSGSGNLSHFVPLFAAVINCFVIAVIIAANKKFQKSLVPGDYVVVNKKIAGTIRSIAAGKVELVPADGNVIMVDLMRVSKPLTDAYRRKQRRLNAVK